MTSTYLAVPELQEALPTSDPSDVALLNIAIEAASRAVDSYCGQRFWQDDTVKTREYYSETCDTVTTDPISTTSGLIVKTDSAGDGTYATTLTISTDFILLPVNAPDNYPVEPYTQIYLPASSFPVRFTKRPNVQVTAQFGWSAVPGDVKAAALLIARDLFKEAKDAPFGVAGIAEFGVLRIRANSTARMLLSRYQKPLVA